MEDEPTSIPRTANRLLGRLSDDEFDEAGPFEHVILELREMVQRADKPIMSVYFPLSGVISVVADDPQGDSVEVATIGREGFSGVPVLLGAESSTGNAFCQISGAALQLTSEAFTDAVERLPSLRQSTQLYTQALFTQLTQSVACNRLHTIQQRAARWLLHTHDRVQGDRFTLTQEFLGQMLGVRRASVSEVAGRLQGEGLIRYSRGKVSIVDRDGLEAKSCACHRIIAHEFDRLLGPS